MSGDQQKRVEDLFDKLVQLPAERREEELQRLCPDDPEVRAEVAGLLNSADAGNSTAGPTFFDHFPKWGIFPDTPGAEPGETASIGPYRILEKLGTGGFGTVFKAEQRHPVKRVVALKIIKPGFDTKEVIARFDSERQALARMDHPNIAMVLDAGATATGRPYFAMEYVAGVSITHFSDKNKLAINDRLLLFLEVCDAITHAHQKAIIHRDIKASNVLGFMRDGKAHVKVIDFGIAKALTSDRLTELTFNTAHGMAIGTFESMSPEQAAGSPDVDTRSDVYSLGVLLYHLLTGVPPLDRKALVQMTETEMRRTICDVDPPTPTQQLRSLGLAASPLAEARKCETDLLVRQLSRELEWIPLKAMRKERDRRYASSQQLAEDIQNYLGGRPLIAGPESNVYRLKKLLHQHRGLVSAAATIMLVLLLGIAATTVEAIEENQQKKVAQVSEAIAKDSLEQAKKEREAALESEEKANHQLGLAFLEKALHSRDDQENFSAAMTAGYAIGFASDPDGGNQHPFLQPDTEDWGTATDISKLRSTPRLLWRSAPGTQHDGPVRSVVFSDDGNLLASGSDDGFARVWTVGPAKGQVKRTFGLQTGPVQSVSFSPDATKLATACNNTVRIWDVENGKVRTLPDERPGGMVRCVVFSKFGNLIASASDNLIRIWNLSAGADDTPAVLNKHTAPVQSICFSRDGTMLASGSLDHTIRLWSTKTGDCLQTILGSQETVNSVSFSPDGNTVASAAKDGSVCLWDLHGTLIRTMEGKFDEMTSVCFSADGKLLAGGSVDRIVRVWDVASGSLQRSIPGHAQAIYSVAFSPDGKVLASGGGDSRIGLWDVATGETLQHLDGLKDIATGVGFSPNGSIVASACGDNSVCLWNSRTGDLLQTFTGGSEVSPSGGKRFVRIAFSPDGAKLATQASDNLAVTVWNVADGKAIWASRGKSLAQPSGAMRACVNFSPDGRKLATAWDDNTVRLWDVTTNSKTPKPLATLSGQHTAPVQCVCFSPDGQTLASGSLDNNICLWDLHTQKAKTILPGNGLPVSSVCFSPDGATLASGGIGGEISLWDATLKSSMPRTLRGDFGYIYSLSFSPDGKTLASGYADHKIRLWNMEQGDPLDMAQSGRPKTISVAADKIASVAFSSDGRMVASASWDSTISVSDVEQDEASPPLAGHTDKVTSICFAPNRNILASGSYDYTARLWDLDGGKPPVELKGHSDHINCICFSPDGNLLATGADSIDGTVMLWDTHSGDHLRRLDTHAGILFTGFSPDGRLLVAGTRVGTIWIWSLDGQLLHKIEDINGDTSNGIYSISFSLDGKTMVSGSKHGDVRLWDVDAGTFRRPLQRQNNLAAHQDRVSGVSFSPDGTLIASGSFDGAICFWDARTGEMKWCNNTDPQPGAPDGIASLKFSPDGRWLATGSRYDGTIRLLDVQNPKQSRTLQSVRGPGVFSLTFSPDSTMLAAPFDSIFIGFWNAQPEVQQRQYRVPLRQYLKVYQFDGPELTPMPSANLYEATGFLAHSQ